MIDRGLDYYAILSATLRLVQSSFSTFSNCTIANYLSDECKREPSVQRHRFMTAASSERFYQSMDSTT